MASHLPSAVAPAPHSAPPHGETARRDGAAPSQPFGVPPIDPAILHRIYGPPVHLVIGDDGLNGARNLVIALGLIVLFVGCVAMVTL